MSSRSIWKEEIEGAILKVVRENITITNFETNKQEPLSDNMVIVRKPENIFKITSYPCISIYNLADRFNETRFVSYPNHEIVGRNYDNKTVSMEAPAHTYDLTYQIDFWAKLQTHMNEITRKWLSIFAPFYNLDVIDMSGRYRNIMMQQKRKDGIKKVDILDANERIYHSVIMYDVWAEINEKELCDVPMVVDIKIRGNEVNRVQHKK